MAKINPHKAKINRSYTIRDIIDLFGVCKDTVLRWIREGLHVHVTTRPFLILGTELRVFLCKKYLKHKKKSGPGQIYCVRCKETRNPKDGFALLTTQDGRAGDLIGECPICGSNIYRKVSLAKIETWKGNLHIKDMRR